jgi:hypothetical protein
MNVTIYDSINFGGRSAALGVGNQSLTGPGAPLDKVASIQVPAGMVALVYELADNVGGYGRSADLMENYADVSTLGLAGIAYVEVFLAERDAPAIAARVAGAAVAGTTATLHENWIRGSVANEQYVAGHWGIAVAQASGTAVVSPGPLPHLLHISNLQGQDWTNPAYNTSGGNWSSQLVGGATFDGSDSHPFEWVSVLNPTLEQDDEVGVAGFAAAVETSAHDLPFTHPFGGDFEFAIVPDAEYSNLLAPSNRPPANSNTDSEVSEAFSQLRTVGLAAAGAFAMEVEAGMVPQPYRAVLGDRVAVYGRWIVDAGHNDFHSEIHPPLLLARAQVVNAQGAQVYPDGSAITFMQLWGRPFQAAQKFIDGSSKNLCLQTYIKNISETAGDIVAYPPIFPKPFDGVHLVSFVVRPPALTPPPSRVAVLGPAHLECSYSFTTNKSCGVQVQQSLSDPNAVEVILALNSVGYPSLPEPPSTKVAYSIDSLRQSIPADMSALTSFLVDVVSDYQKVVHGGNLYVRTYNPLPAPDVTTHAVPFTPLSTLPRSQVNVDDTQPYPIVGWLKLQWVHSSIVVGGGLHEVAAAPV